MIDLSKITDDVLMARGAHSTVNAKLREEVTRLRTLCETLSGMSTRILRHMQPDGDGIPTTPDVQLDLGRATLAEMELCATAITELLIQKRDLRVMAWGGKK